ncbi:30S ribosomal protein S16 [Patescibacteria group bacterium]|nr:30S ribosomal protein S16 [Patescibacteria group bacterium]MBU4353293.1 30S ribosomal protein S16 [Patescibacteria group bacterium]MBU4477348.1 30S ribosomal protein S16 [Patescibacteria group bacterium]MCG2699238.1 30S ribosomal protein S16 [Candidatus Parcubacteria bacterium]
MLKIRLQRVGRKHDPSFRVVLVDSRRAAKSGSFLEILGVYNARKGEPQFDSERIKEWISKGAQLSGTVHNLLVRKKIIKAKKINVLPPKKKLTEKKAGV